MSTAGQIRSFNRFYTNFLGLLNNRILGSPLSLSESRVLYELAHNPNNSAVHLAETLQMDKGYLSRILKRFEKDGYVLKVTATSDRRVKPLALSPEGKSLFRHINGQSEKQIKRLVSHLNQHDKTKLANMLGEAEILLRSEASAKPALDEIKIRTNLKAGDLGFIIKDQCRMYYQEYSYGWSFEQYVAAGTSEFIEQYNPDRSRCWICEHGGNNIGFLLLMDRGTAAQLRFFFVLAPYRGIGLGKKLMQLYMRFLKRKGYKSSYLWTTNEQHAAAALYQKFGFNLTKEVPSTKFGRPVIEQRYDLVV